MSRYSITTAGPPWPNALTLAAPMLVARHVVERPDIADTERPAGLSADHPGHVIGYQDPAKVSVHQRAHQLLHIGVSAVHEGLGEIRNRRRHVAEVDLPQLPHPGELPRRAIDVLAGIFATFRPRPAAQADPDIGTVRDLHGPHIPVEVAENAARHAAQL